MSIVKNFGKLKQWTNEKFGHAGKTEASDEFRQLEQQTEARRECADVLLLGLTKYARTLDEKKLATVGSEKQLPLMCIGAGMIHLGSLMETSSQYGAALMAIGEVEEKLAGIQTEYLSKIRSGYLAHLEGYISEMKEYSHLKKKLENRRLDYDAKLNKVQKSKKEKLNLEEEMRMAQAKYEETLQDTTDKMISLSGHEDVHLDRLMEFVSDQVEYHRASLEALERLQGSMENGRNGTAGLTSRRIRTSSARSNSSRSSHGTDSILTNGHQQATIVADPEPLSTTRRLPPQRSPSNSSLKVSDNRPSSVIAGPGIPMPHMLSSDNLHSYTVPAPSAPPLIRRPPSPEPAVQAHKQVIATFDFTASAGDELSMVKGDIIAVVEEVDEGWWMGEITDATGIQRRGLFPSNYVEPYSVPLQSQPRIPPPSPRAQQSRHSTAHNLSRSVSSQSIGSTYSNVSSYSNYSEGTPYQPNQHGSSYNINNMTKSSSVNSLSSSMGSGMKISRSSSYNNVAMPPCGTCGYYYQFDY
ncbi:hypothetical protein BKA69DRAFT_1122898 [Paraphysoderma sedebokerense]|nr:hypothetical protein BKA69DRAFT_1122898 [Paraphysoderma sedebokerense]